MEMIILKTNNKSFKIPMSIYKLVSGINGDYTSLSEKIVEIIFENYVFDKYERFDLAENQTITFSNCVFNGDVFVYGGKLNILNSEFNYSLNVCACKEFNWKIGSYNYVSSTSLEADSVNVYGGIYQSKKLAVVTKNLNINDCIINANSFNLEADNMNIVNSNFEFCDFSWLAYRNLKMKNFSFGSQFGCLSFFKIMDNTDLNDIHYNEVVTYKFPVVLDDDYFNNDKNKNISSLLSILKGYSLKLEKINNYDAKMEHKKIDLELAKHLEEIEKQREYLDVKEKHLRENFNMQKDVVSKELLKRKIKSLEYPKE